MDSGDARRAAPLRAARLRRPPRRLRPGCPRRRLQAGHIPRRSTSRSGAIPDAIRQSRSTRTLRSSRDPFGVPRGGVRRNGGPRRRAARRPPRRWRRFRSFRDAPLRGLRRVTSSATRSASPDARPHTGDTRERGPRAGGRGGAGGEASGSESRRGAPARLSSPCSFTRSGRRSRTWATAACTWCTRGRIFQVTRDHSMVQEMVEAKILTPDQAARAPGREQDHPRPRDRRRRRGGGPCADAGARRRGRARFSAPMGSATSSTPVGAPRRGELRSAAQAVGKLVDLANARGGYDNITVVIVRPRVSAPARHGAPRAPVTTTIPARDPSSAKAPPMMAVIPAPPPRRPPPSARPPKPQPSQPGRGAGLSPAAVGLARRRSAWCCGARTSPGADGEADRGALRRRRARLVSVGAGAAASVASPPSIFPQASGIDAAGITPLSRSRPRPVPGCDTRAGSRRSLRRLPGPLHAPHAPSEGLSSDPRPRQRDRHPRQRAGQRRRLQGPGRRAAPRADRQAGRRSSSSSISAQGPSAANGAPRRAESARRRSTSARSSPSGRRPSRSRTRRSPLMLMSPGELQAPRGQVIVGREASRASLVIAHPAVSGHARDGHARPHAGRRPRARRAARRSPGSASPPNQPVPDRPNGVIAFGPVPVPVGVLVAASRRRARRGGSRTAASAAGVAHRPRRRASRSVPNGGASSPRRPPAPDAAEAPHRHRRAVARPARQSNVDHHRPHAGQPDRRPPPAGLARSTRRS